MNNIDVINSQIEYWGNLYATALSYRRIGTPEEEAEKIKQELDYWKQELKSLTI